ncbi:MAG: ECF-type sigma factor [Verrucomicrobiota bacterium]
MDELVSRQPSATVGGQLFPTTHWTTLLAPIRDRGDKAEAALERLCEIYRQPLVACARHLLRDNPSEAEDVVHDYICSLLRREDLAKVQRERGKFRAFLAAGIRNQVINHIQTRRAQKRGGGTRTVSLDEMVIEPADLSTAEVTLCRSWIQASVAEVLRLISEEWTAAGKGEEFNDFKDFALSKKTDVPRAELAAKYGVSANAIDAKISRFRRRFRELLRELICQTVSRPEEVDEEIRFLLSTLGK